MKNQTQFEQQYGQEEQNQQFSYQKFVKTHSFPVPSIAKHAKYNSMLSLEQLNFLEYFMLPQKDEFDYVYRPGDDSFFMLNVLKRQLGSWVQKWGQNLINQKSFQNCVIAQIGSGSGIISAHVSSWLKKINQQPLLHLSIDINMDASFLSKKYYDHYNLNIEQINTSFFKNTIVSEKNQFWRSFQPQIILFNPPYIPVEEEQIQNQHKYLVQKIKSLKQNKKCQRKRQQNMIAYSYMGGTDGLYVTRKLLKSIFWNCWVYLIIMESQGYQKIRKQLMQKQFWIQHQPMFQISANVELLQFMKYQNQDLFLIRVQIISKKKEN